MKRFVFRTTGSYVEELLASDQDTLVQEDISSIPVELSSPIDETHNDKSNRLRWFGVGLILVQGVAMMLWSTILWQRFALTWDYAVYHQAWWLLAHGHLDPYVSVLAYQFWRDNFELMMWPLALLGVVFSHGPILLLLQDICLIAAELVVWIWMWETTIAKTSRYKIVLAVSGLILLVANPWAWWSISFDFHMELIALPFVVFALYDLLHGRSRAWYWVIAVLLCGNAEASWIAGIGIGALLAGRRWRTRGIILLLLGVGWVLFSTSIHGNNSSNVTKIYGHLIGPGGSHVSSVSGLVVGILRHPQGVISALWANRVDIWANISPSGIIGLASPWTFGFSLPIILGNGLVNGQVFIRPLFQNVALYVVLPLGTMFVLVKVLGRRPLLACSMGVLAAINALAWSVTWGGRSCSYLAQSAVGFRWCSCSC